MGPEGDKKRLGLVPFELGVLSPCLQAQQLGGRDNAYSRVCLTSCSDLGGRGDRQRKGVQLLAETVEFFCLAISHGKGEGETLLEAGEVAPQVGDSGLRGPELRAELTQVLAERAVGGLQPILGGEVVGDQASLLRRRRLKRLNL